MLGLIKKDLLMIKSNLKVIIIFLILYGFMALENMTDLSFMTVFISVVLFFSTFSYDEYNNWNLYAATFLKGRENIVKSKYIASLLLAFIAVVLTIGVSIIIGKINNNLNMENIISSVLGSVLAVVVIISVSFPLIFKLGVEKGRIWLFGIVFGISGIGALVYKFSNFKFTTKVLEFLDNYFILISLGLSVIFVLVSYFISKGIFMRKEF